MEAWCRDARECLAMLLRPGNAGSSTFTDHREVLAAEVTHLMSRAENWPGGLQRIARRVKPSRRQMRNLTDYEKNDRVAVLHHLHEHPGQRTLAISQTDTTPETGQQHNQ